ncbi:protein kinase [Streptomyces sp. 15-116A]|uniref:serine/threonine-protein kinase n=1 Tax=Streptomyces sp. 15-116A TaxID=2259035 RepID=UPI0021B3B5D4|nr:serine/threonine-protein kinase [Streptomyces sp. 15-116A]MCT7355875.1 protein kinase [Streptomyces sp. 15-116A]
MSSGEHGQADGAGRLLAGRYRITRQLGRGGMGVVWQAVDEVLGREVALKELRTYTDAAEPELADLRLRMQREARAAARVRHPGVIAVHDIAEVDGRPLIVMELVDGPSLDDVLRDRGTLEPREAAGIGAKVMDALAAAHRAGVLHRDVKPGNILLDRSGRVVLTDFGIATMDDPGDGSATHLTRSGEIVGSLDYLAPERAQGADPGPASDVWALGATLYAAVEGASPFRRTSTFSTLTAIVGEPLPEPRRAGPLAPVLQLLMDKRPASRPEAEEARALLETVANATGTDDLSTTSLRQAPPAAPRTETERSVPAVPPGFGPPQQPPAGPAHGQAPGYGQGQGQGQGPGYGQGPGSGHGNLGAQHAAGAVSAHPSAGAVPAHHPADSVSAPTGPMDTGSRSRRKSRVLLAALAVTVVLAAAGTTVALLGSPDETRASEQATDARPGTRPSTASSVSPDAGRSESPEATGDGDDESGAPSAKPDEKDKTTAPTDRPTAAAPKDKPAGGTTGGGGGAGDGGGATTQAPVCHPIGGGKYNCQVWRTATSYTASGTEAGILNAGTNYFYCQQNLGRRETHGEWTNVWWAKTDDDSGNTGVWVSDVYIKGGDNDAPVPGLPYC